MEKEKTTIEITGMSCTNCALAIEKTLKKTKGVIEANINFATEKGYVEYDPSIIKIDDIYTSIEEIGYGVKKKPNNQVK